MNKKKCAHGFELDSRGFHIPKSEKSSEKSTAELIEEAKKLFSAKTAQTVPVKTERQKELEELTRKYQKIFAENRGKIPNEFPKTIFDRKKNNEE
ncbi:MAG: hypothetical protein ACRD93_05025 [Nitrososphaeraceae archaeon]